MAATTTRNVYTTDEGAPTIFSGLKAENNIHERIRCISSIYKLLEGEIREKRYPCVLDDVLMAAMIDIPSMFVVDENYHHCEDVVQIDNSHLFSLLERSNTKKIDRHKADLLVSCLSKGFVLDFLSAKIAYLSALLIASYGYSSLVDPGGGEAGFSDIDISPSNLSSRSYPVRERSPLTITAMEGSEKSLAEMWGEREVFGTYLIAKLADNIKELVIDGNSSSRRSVAYFIDIYIRSFGSIIPMIETLRLPGWKEGQKPKYILDDKDSLCFICAMLKQSFRSMYALGMVRFEYMLGDALRIKNPYIEIPMMDESSSSGDANSRLADGSPGGKDSQDKEQGVQGSIVRQPKKRGCDMIVVMPLMVRSGKTSRIHSRKCSNDSGSLEHKGNSAKKQRSTSKKSRYKSNRGGGELEDIVDDTQCAQPSGDCSPEPKPNINLGRITRAEWNNCDSRTDNGEFGDANNADGRGPCNMGDSRSDFTSVGVSSPRNYSTSGNGFSELTVERPQDEAFYTEASAEEGNSARVPSKPEANYTDSPKDVEEHSFSYSSYEEDEEDEEEFDLRQSERLQDKWLVKVIDSSNDFVLELIPVIDKTMGSGGRALKIVSYYILMYLFLIFTPTEMNRIINLLPSTSVEKIREKALYIMRKADSELEKIRSQALSLSTSTKVLPFEDGRKGSSGKIDVIYPTDMSPNRTAGDSSYSLHSRTSVASSDGKIGDAKVLGDSSSYFTESGNNAQSVTNSDQLMDPMVGDGTKTMGGSSKFRLSSTSLSLNFRPKHKRDKKKIANENQPTTSEERSMSGTLCNLARMSDIIDSEPLPCIESKSEINFGHLEGQIVNSKRDRGLRGAKCSAAWCRGDRGEREAMIISSPITNVENEYSYSSTGRETKTKQANLTGSATYVHLDPSKMSLPPISGTTRSGMTGK